MPNDPNIGPPNPEANVDGCPVPADQELLADGWVRRHLVSPDRAQESIELYLSLGFEVRARKLTPADFALTCQQCASSVCRSYVLIYTRRQESNDAPDSSKEPVVES